MGTPVCACLRVSAPVCVQRTGRRRQVWTRTGRHGGQPLQRIKPILPFSAKCALDTQGRNTLCSVPVRPSFYQRHFARFAWRALGRLARLARAPLVWTDRRPIRTSKGESLPVTRGRYNALRGAWRRGDTRALCKAPWVCLDIGPDGDVRACNHGGEVLGNASRESLMAIWRGGRAKTARRHFADCTISTECVHCVHQLRIDNPLGTFAHGHFDLWRMQPAGEGDFFPRILILRMGNQCNLKCVMCDGLTSSRIRHEVDHLPPIGTVYPESLFGEIREFLCHAEYVEFYGGEPFLVPANLRILDLLMEMPPQDRPALFVNTNATLLTERIKRYLEELPFRSIAISLDGMTPAINARVRVGVDHDAVLSHIHYLHEYARRKRVRLVFNVTETRQNWFGIPDIFRFAAGMGVFVHINHCIFPDHCVLYTLDPSQLGFVLKRLTRERRLLRRAGGLGASAASYEFLLRCLRENYARRQGQRDGGDESACGVAVEADGTRFDGRLAMPGVEWVSSRGETYLKEFLDDLPRGIPWADQYRKEFVKGLVVGVTWNARQKGTSG